MAFLNFYRASQKHRIQFEEEWSKAVNRFEREFLADFADKTGGIDWEKLTQFNSGKEVQKFTGRKAAET
jgi:hypothetical protein